MTYEPNDDYGRFIEQPEPYDQRLVPEPFQTSTRPERSRRRSRTPYIAAAVAVLAAAGVAVALVVHRDTGKPADPAAAHAASSSASGPSSSAGAPPTTAPATGATTSDAEFVQRYERVAGSEYVLVPEPSAAVLASAAHGVCAGLRSGQPLSVVVTTLRRTLHASDSKLGFFAGAAIGYYCPEQKPKLPR